MKMKFLRALALCLLLQYISTDILYGQSGAIKFTVDRGVCYQTIDNFGASDAWRMAFIGENWPLERREEIADLLFSQKMDSRGNPIGIGLSGWRVNVGAGSYENHRDGAEDEVTSQWNRTECFLSPDGSYDFSLQAGQQWFMRAARDRGVEDFLLFTNSAPYFMTRSGSTIAPDGDMINLQSDKFDDFADFLALTAKHFIDEGFNIRYISPINEPQIDWGQNKWQEGSFATNSDAYRLITELDRAISRHGVPVEVMFGEAADMCYLFDCNQEDANVPDNIIEELFTKDGRYSIIGMENVANTLSAHDYWSAYPAEKLVSTRERIDSALKANALSTRFWASEYCILEKNDEITGYPLSKRSIDLGLYVARIIHSDLAIANASAWQWWTAVSFAEDVAIELKTKENSTARSLLYDGVVSPTKMHWATGNYSLFVRPGMWRVGLNRLPGLSTLDSATDLMASAYSDGDRVVLVFVNYSDQGRDVKVDCIGAQEGSLYETSQNRDLEFLGVFDLSEIEIAPRSIVTVVI